MSPTIPGGDLVVDASFVIGLFVKSPDAARFMSVLERSNIPDVNLGEVFYKLNAIQQVDPAEILRSIAAKNLSVVGLGMASMKFPELKHIDAASRAAQEAVGTPPAEIKTLSLGDMCCLAVALERGLPVLTGDKHWLTLTLPIRVFDFRNKDLGI